jgi:hemerythrin
MSKGENAMHETNSNHSLSVGLKMLDRDHREIHAIIHELSHGAAQQCDRASLVSLLRQLERISASHFVLEEGMMTAARFPLQELHRLRHEWMLEEIKRTLADWTHSSSGSGAPEQTASMLLGSHTSHVKHEDLKFGVWLDGRGLTRAV